jgi:hypothetical protein
MNVPLKQPELHEQLNPPWLNEPLKQPELHEQLNPPWLNVPLKQPELHEQLNQPWLNVPLKQPELHEQLNPPWLNVPLKQHEPVVKPCLANNRAFSPKPQAKSKARPDRGSKNKLSAKTSAGPELYQSQ